MRIFLILVFFCLQTMSAVSQTATDFTATDCSGVSHELFSELDSGNVIVLCWVMPCGSCVPAALTTYNVVQSYSSGYPGKVRMYVCDDFADNTCSQINSWCNSNGLINTSRFSDSKIKMSDYGAAGMPKIVVIGGGTSHLVYFNEISSVAGTELQAAIDSALAESTNLRETENYSHGYLSPNPASNSSSLVLKNRSAGNCSIRILTMEGKTVVPFFTVSLSQGDNEINLPVSDLGSGIYIVHVSENGKESEYKLSVNR